jgi:crotonobetainyl-CoA:carnitine CoA-transferase CaiB-like acyl-CoA transferase
MMLGDLGADVIKIEAPGRGDDTRQWGPPFTKSGMSAYFISANRNKRSVTLNLKSDEGMQILKDLLKISDVVVDNFRVGTLEKMGLSYEEMQEIKPDIIYCTITGFGYSGPYSHKPGYDFIVQALSGLMSLTGPVDGRPQRVGVAIADLLTGIYASNAITAALYAREQSGKGQRIDSSLFDSQVATLSYVASNYLNSGEAPKRLGNAHPNIVPYQDFKASDGSVAFAAGNDLQWGKFCKAAGKDEWVEDERFATNPKRVENREILVPLLDELFSKRSVEAWLKLCDQAGIPAAPINSVDQVFEDPQAAARDLVMEAELQSGDKVRMAGSPLNTVENPPELFSPPPQLGEHNEEVLRKLLDYKSEDIRRLESENII